MVMSIDRAHYENFKRGSKTYFYSSLFFPRGVRRDVFTLYGFVRTADDFVDAVPQDIAGFRRFREEYHRALGVGHTYNPIIESFVELLERKDFDPQWVNAFFSSMEMDLTQKNHFTLDEVLEYIYGSGEVIGLFMAKIMGLSRDSYPYARILGRAMQYINFIRDIEEDRQMGRTYLPLEDSGLDSLDYEHTLAKSDIFRHFIQVQIERYREWQAEAEKGFAYIPRSYLIPIKTASDMYKWTAHIIEHNPFVVYYEKVKPSRNRIIIQALLNTLRPMERRSKFP
jgi:phytoene synthase